MSALGERRVAVLSLPQWLRTRPAGNDSLGRASRAKGCPFRETLRRVGRRIPPLRRMSKAIRESKMQMRLQRVRERLPYLTVDHPIDLLAGVGSTTNAFATAEIDQYYEDAVRQLGNDVVCVIEHVGFSRLLPINRRLGIPTISCVQNIEAFDTIAPANGRHDREIYLAAIEFADEIQILAQCVARLFISKIEVSLVSGLGLRSEYYAYVPVGELRRHFDWLREARTEHSTTSRRFVMLGSGDHSTTWDAFSWFVNCARSIGLPKGIQVVVVGSGTDRLLPPGESVQGIELRGWVEQDELSRLLTTSQGVLCPQRVGFGALTRLSELACAGVPVISSRHPTYAIDLPPGISVVDDEWDKWCGGIEEFARKSPRFDHEDYLSWEAKQPQPIGAVVENARSGLKI